MLTITIILTCLVVLHFIYEAILLPSIRMSLRFKLFTLRDRIRLLKYTHEDRFDTEVFGYLHQATNNTIGILHQLDVGTVLQGTNAISQNPALKKKIKRRTNAIDQCALGEIDEIRKSMAKIAMQAIIANNGAWFVYLFPVVVVILAYSRLKNVVSPIIDIVNAPENDFNKIVPTISPLTS